MTKEQKFYKGVSKWLEQSEVSSGRVQEIVGGFKKYSKDVLKDVGEGKIAVLGKIDRHKDRHLWLYYLWGEPIDVKDGRLVRRLHEIGSAFTRTIQLSSMPDIFFHQEFVSPSEIQPSSFVTEISEMAREEGAVYLGVIPTSSVRVPHN